MKNMSTGECIQFSLWIANGIIWADAMQAMFSALMHHVMR